MTGRQEDKAREVALRRRAQRLGLVVQRSRARRPDDPSHGLYRLGHLTTRRLFAAESPWLDLDRIAGLVADREMRDPR
jgi:hypothetical protein